MVTKRPALPMGYVISGLPPIVRVFHSDSDIEIYGLAGNAGGVEEIVSLQRGDPTGSRRWWSHLEDATLRMLGELDISMFPGFSVGARFSTNGRHLEGVTFSQANTEELQALLFGLIDCVTEGRQSGFLPDFSATFCWQSADSQVASVLPLRGEFPSEPEAIRYVARTFFRFATGIHVKEGATAIPPLSQWCKGAGALLSRVMDDCLGSERSKRRIETFAQLHRELGRQGSGAGLEMAEPAGSQAAATNQPHGLDRVGGMRELKQLLRTEVVEPVRNPEPFRQYGLSIPNGILLYGPPGCGKTYIARALADELGHHFLEIVPSELASPFVHGSVIRIREMFDEAVQQAPSVVFIDEFEALAPVRSGLGGFQHHKAEEVNEILTHLNGSSEKQVFIVAATNQPEMIDPAIRRTGRLDKLIYVGPPDAEARADMLRLHLGVRPVSSDLDLNSLASRLEGYSASDLRFLVDEAARDAMSRKIPIAVDSFNRAMLRIVPSVPPEAEAQYRSIAQRGL